MQLKFKSNFKIFKFLTIRRLVILFVVIAILSGVFYRQFLIGGGKEEVKYVSVSKGSIISTVSASGTLAGKDKATLHFKGSGKLISLTADTGDRVREGQLLAALDSTDLSISLKQAENTLQAKEAELKKVIDDIHLFQYGNGGFPNVGSANETMTQRMQRIEAEVAKNNAFDSVKLAKRAFADFSIFSPISGIVTQKGVLSGQFVGPTDLVLTVVDDSKIYFDAEVDESDIMKISEEQRAEVELNSFPGQKFAGIVEKIIPTTKTISSGATVVIVRILIDTVGIRFIDNLNGTATISSGESSNVLIIPQEALLDDEFLLTAQNDKYKKVKVVKGRSSERDVEIISGINEGEKVVLNPAVVDKNRVLP